MCEVIVGFVHCSGTERARESVRRHFLHTSYQLTRTGIMEYLMHLFFHMKSLKSVLKHYQDGFYKIMHRCFTNYCSGMRCNACAVCVKMCHELDSLLNSHFVTLFFTLHITKASNCAIL